MCTHTHHPIKAHPVSCFRAVASAANCSTLETSHGRATARRRRKAAALQRHAWRRRRASQGAVPGSARGRESACGPKRKRRELARGSDSWGARRPTSRASAVAGSAAGTRESGPAPFGRRPRGHAARSCEVVRGRASPPCFHRRACCTRASSSSRDSRSAAWMKHRLRLGLGRGSRLGLGCVGLGSNLGVGMCA